MTAVGARLAPQGVPRRRTQARRETLLFYLCISPWLIGFIVFVAGPMIASLVLSFTRWDMLSPPEWVGMKNYVHMFTADPDFWQSLKVTAVYTVFSVPLRLLTALFLAILLNEATRGVGIFRTAFYLPSIVASVAAAVLWSWILNPKFGPVNGALRLFGIKGPSWFSDPRYALWGLVIMSTWGVGGEMLIFLAGLKSIPQQLYEAAEIDGAGRWVRFTRVTLPMLSPTIFFNFVMSMIGSFQTGVRYLHRPGGDHRRPDELHAFLHASPLSQRLRVAEDGICFGLGLGALPDHPGVGIADTPLFELVGLLRSGEEGVAR